MGKDNTYDNLKKSSSSNNLIKVKNIFAHSITYLERTNAGYLADVKKTQTLGVSSRGIKGPSVLSEFVNIPDQILFDKMHTTARGAMEDLANLWLNSNFSHKQWYIGSPTSRIEIDRRLSSVKYSIEFHRTTKSIQDYNTLKCSELENMEFYIGVLIAENILDQKYIDHFLTYVIALRLLTKDKVELDDISCASTLLNYFVMRFEKLYGLEHMTYKLHTLTHLPLQVLNFGPLHKHSAFHFEGN